ncbi:hypothetical protein VNO78_31754 [Psophocarpus tetragonolobus]|uniref:Uncharacterized protein n=1 Tax=Psophocarpus tetragonolobus TaxID=3891 RepID=A0AAN9RZI1_PSOTE
MESVLVSGEVDGAGGAYLYESWKRLDQLWSSICSSQEGSFVQEPQRVVSTIPDLFGSSDIADKTQGSYDVLVCGGTMGIFIATALCARGLRVAIVERNILKGREQEWNISTKELLELVENEVLEEDDIEIATTIKFNPVLKLSQDKMLSSRLIINAMGNFSPVVKQIRCGRKPDGVFLVVGTCARGFKTTPLVMVFDLTTLRYCELFLESFPYTARVRYQLLLIGFYSGIQSPVSFGGFSSLARHLGRLSVGIHETINGDYLDSYNLSLLNPYMPNLSASWDLVIQCSARFLQDVVQFGPLSKTLGLVMLANPQIIPSIFNQVGIPVLLDWSGYFVGLGYSTLILL